ncbi:MAG: AraC family transcriptional regulator, partial [Cyanobacteria bacterium P01_D01_bin.56]
VNRQVITPEMKVIMEQILSCPYQGETRRQYLEKKTLDLVTLRVQAITQPRLNPTDLDSIYQAASILKSEMANPPTVEALARRVNTNRLKLNQGFHEVYGTTPFKYLRDCRLWMAQRLLTTSTLPIESIAAAVGYRSRNHFAKAFRKQTGLNPKLFQMQAWPYAS